MTRAGPEPVEARSGAPLDYEHYLERQLRPIAQSIAQALGTTADEWLGDAGQLGLFASPDAGAERFRGPRPGTAPYARGRPS